MLRMRSIFSRICGFLLALAVALLLLAMIIDGLGSSAPLMQKMMTSFAPADATGLPAEEYPGMARMITGYLSGREKTFQYTWTDAEGVTYLAFRDYEQQHMADCFQLFVLCRKVALGSALAVGVCMGAAWLLRDRRRISQGFFLGSAVTILSALALIVWGLVDFDGLFILFHQISFDNGLWLLNPATDLLIRLMPTHFFVTYAAVLGISWLGGMLLVLLLSWRMMKIRR